MLIYIVIFGPLDPYEFAIGDPLQRTQHRRYDLLQYLRIFEIFRAYLNLKENKDMLSFLFFALHTAIMVLSYIFPDLIGIFLLISAVMVSYVWFRRESLFLYNARFYRGLFILPIIALAVISIQSKIGFFALWLLYATVILINYVIPILKFLILRLRLYSHIKKLIKTKGYRSSVNLFKTIFFGSHTPYNIVVETPEKIVNVGVLGSVSASRYIFGQSTIVSQKFGNGKRYMMEYISEIEKFEEDMEYIFPKLGPSFLGNKYRSYLPETADTDNSILLLHPNCFIQNEEKIVGVGEKIWKYRIVSLKTVFAVL